MANVDKLNEGKLIKRSKRVSFMNVGTTDEPKYIRMQGFSSMSESKSAKEYSRQYVDEDTERSDVVGYATQIGYSFDRHSPFSVHEKIAEITDNEYTGSDATVEIVTVDLFTDGDAKVARKRAYSVIPDTTGDGTDALIYSGNFRAAGEFTLGTATSSDKWQTVTFTEGNVSEPAPELGKLTVNSVAGANTGATKVTATPSKAPGNTYRYKTGVSVSLPAYDEDCSSMTNWDGAADITATTGQKILIVECAESKARKAGIATITSKA